MLPLGWKRRFSSNHRKWQFEAPRWTLAHPLPVLNVGGDGGRRTLLGYAENISCGGMMIGTVWPKPAGTLLEIEFALPAPADLVAHSACEVVWARPHSADPDKPGMGLRFLDLPGDAARAIESLFDGEQGSHSRPRRTWSEYDREWIPWTPRAPQ